MSRRKTERPESEIVVVVVVVAVVIAVVVAVFVAVVVAVDDSVAVVIVSVVNMGVFSHTVGPTKKVSQFVLYQGVAKPSISINI